MSLLANPHFSRLALGTVQFGLPYGVANAQGQPSYTTCRNILAAALDEGITTLDTAAAYGESEAVLGRALQELGAWEQVTLVSKSRSVSEGGVRGRAAEAFIEKSLTQSLKNLGTECLPVFLLHDEKDVAFMGVLQNLKDRSLAARVGISIDTPAGAMAALENGKVEALQMPFNLLDHRLDGMDILGQCAHTGIPIFARSAFLQGLLLLSEERIPAALTSVIPVRRQLEALAKKSGMGMVEMCLRYSLSFRGITSVLIGVDSVEQLQENARMAERGPLPPDLLANIASLVPDFPEAIVRPRCWPK